MTKNETIDILVTYRERLKNQYEKPGWNKWALFGALASLIWVTINLLEENDFEYTNAIKLLLTAILFEESMSLIIQDKGQEKPKTIYIDAKGLLAERKSYVFYKLLLFVSILWYSYKFISYEIDWWNYFYYTFIGVLILIHMCFFFIPLINHPIPLKGGKQDKKKGKTIKKIVRVVFILTGIISAGQILHSIIDLKDYSLWKSFCILYGFYFVIGKISENIHRHPLIGRIDDLVDEVTFENADGEATIKKLKLIMIGLELQDAISPLLNEFFELEKQINDKIILLNELILRLEQEQDSIKITALKESFNSNFDQFQNTLFFKLKKITKKISSRLSVYSRFENDAAGILLVQDTLNNNLDGIQAKLNILRENAQRNAKLLNS